MLPKNKTKNFIRKKIKVVLKNIPTEIKIKNNKIIAEKLLSLAEFKKAKGVMFYISKGDEVNTHMAIKEAIKLGKDVAAPKIINKKIIPFKIYSFADLSIGKFSILEPLKNKKIKKSRIDLFVIPGIAFDIFCNRVGYGYGYWDKFLNDVDKKSIIGLAFDIQIVKKISTEPHDITISKIITEKRIIGKHVR